MAKRAFLDFLDQADYMQHVESMLKRGTNRLLLSLDELRSFDAELTREYTCLTFDDFSSLTPIVHAQETS